MKIGDFFEINYVLMMIFRSIGLEFLSTSVIIRRIDRLMFLNCVHELEIGLFSFHHRRIAFDAQVRTVKKTTTVELKIVMKSNNFWRIFSTRRILIGKRQQMCVITLLIELLFCVCVEGYLLIARSH